MKATEIKVLHGDRKIDDAGKVTYSPDCYIRSSLLTNGGNIVFARKELHKQLDKLIDSIATDSLKTSIESNNCSQSDKHG